MSDNISAQYTRTSEREEAALSELVTASTSDGSYFFTASVPPSPCEIALVQFSELGRRSRAPVAAVAAVSSSPSAVLRLIYSLRLRERQNVEKGKEGRGRNRKPFRVRT